MKVLLINGSPRGERSNSYQLARAFVEGLGTGCGEPPEVEVLQVRDLNIKPCLGCFSCWNKTPGTCCIQDDMAGVIEKLLWADVTIWSFPLYYFSVPGRLKNLIDRQLPMVLPFMAEREDAVGNGNHPTRYDMTGKRTVLISTCGFYTAQGNYDGVCSLFDHICGKDAYTPIFCGQGELFRTPELAQRTGEYLGYVRTAGEEFAKGDISAATRKRLEELLFPKETFEAMADASWGVSPESGEKESEALSFTRQMAALYRKESYRGKDQVLEMCYTDLDECYQIVLGAEGVQVLTDGSRAATTRIETPYSVWRAIAAGEIRGDEALMQQRYKVKGDFDLMLHWDDYFGSGSTGAQSRGEAAGTPAQEKGLNTPDRKTNMLILLLPWMAFWIAAAIDERIGSLVSLGVCALVPLVFYRNRKTVYDALSAALVSSASIAVLLGAAVRLVVPLSYLAFGVMWSLSCLRKIPLTAHYSMNNYDGEEALKNPIFLKTNRILTLAWGGLYLITPIWTYPLMGTAVGSYIGAINSVCPILMGIFTGWFQKWYPAKVARGD